MTERPARLLLSAIFVAGGARAAALPGHRVDLAARAGVPRPQMAVRLNGAAMVVAGVALARGVRPRLAAAVLLTLLAPTTAVGHPFWRANGAEREEQLTHVLKNLGLAGGLLAVQQRATR